MKKLFLLCSALLSFLLSADSVTFLSKPMSVGKALLAEKRLFVFPHSGYGGFFSGIETSGAAGLQFIGRKERTFRICMALPAVGKYCLL